MTPSYSVSDQGPSCCKGNFNYGYAILLTIKVFEEYTKEKESTNCFENIVEKKAIAQYEPMLYILWKTVTKKS